MSFNRNPLAVVAYADALRRTASGDLVVINRAKLRILVELAMASPRYIEARVVTRRLEKRAASNSVKLEGE